MLGRVFVFAALIVAVGHAGVVEDVRSAIAGGDLARGDAAVRQYRSQKGVTPEFTEAVSWLARGALDRKDYPRAERYATEAREAGRQLLTKQNIDSDRGLAIGVGAAIEVHARVLAARGEKDEAVAYLQSELKRFAASSVRPRIQKNLNLLTLESKPAPALDVAQWVGPKPQPLAALRGKPVLLFFWAHWCGDCKSEVPVLARIKAEYGGRVAIVMPTQTYGYVAGGEEAGPEAERKYIDEVRKKFYGPVADAPAPISTENFQRYGASTTPTIVLIDRGGIVRLFHPGNMTFEELKVYLDKLVAAPTRLRIPSPRRSFA